MFSSQVVSIGAEGSSDGVVLSIMNIRVPKKGLVASVFWDLGCTSNFVREAFARQCGYKGYPEKLSVTTLGGVVTEYKSVTRYRCSLIDQNGHAVSFDAYGMESITGSVSQVDGSVLRRLFPHVSDRVLRSLQRADDVDILIGISHPSWHPSLLCLISTLPIHKVLVVDVILVGIIMWGTSRLAVITSKNLVVGVSTSTLWRSILQSPIKNNFLSSEPFFPLKV